MSEADLLSRIEALEALVKKQQEDIKLLQENQKLIASGRGNLGKYR